MPQRHDDPHNALFRHLSQFTLSASSSRGNEHLPECPLSPRSIGSFWSDSDSEDEFNGDEDQDLNEDLDRLSIRAQGSQSTLASSDRSTVGFRGQSSSSSRWSSASSTSTLRSDSGDGPSMKVAAKASIAQIPQGPVAQASNYSLSKPQTYPTRPPLKTHSSSPIPASPILPDVFVDSSPKMIDQAQLSPWSMPARLGPAPGLERRRSWQSSTKSSSASTSLHRQALAGREGPRQDGTIGSPLSTPSNRITQAKEARTSGPSFTSRFNPFPGTSSSPAEEQRERIARMAAQVVSSFSPYETPTRASQDSSAFETRGLASSPKTQSFGLGFDFDGGGGGLGEVSVADHAKIGSTACHSSGIWAPEGGFPSWHSSKRTSMPVPARMGASAAFDSAYKTPLILQANSPSMHDSPALGATAQSCWSSSPFPASPRVDFRSPSFVETVEEVATGSPLSPRSNSLSPLPSRRPSTTISRKGSFCSSPLAGEPLNADALKDEGTFDSTASSRDIASTVDASDTPSSPSLDMAEVQYLLGYVQRQIDKMSTPKTGHRAAFEGSNSSARRGSAASDSAPHDWNQYRWHKEDFQSSRGASPYLSAAETWASPSPSTGGSLQSAGKGFCKSPSLPGLAPPSPLSPGISLPSSVSDSWLSSSPKLKAQAATSHQASPAARAPIPTIVGTPATPLRERTSNIRHPHSELPRRSLPGLTPPRSDGGRGSSCSEAGYKSDSPEGPTRRKPTKRGKRSGKRVQQARSERLFREEAEEQGNSCFESTDALVPSPLSAPLRI